MDSETPQIQQPSGINNPSLPNVDENAPANNHVNGNGESVADAPEEPPSKKAKLDDPTASSNNGQTAPPRVRGTAPIKPEYAIAFFLDIFWHGYAKHIYQLLDSLFKHPSTESPLPQPTQTTLLKQPAKRNPNLVRKERRRSPVVRTRVATSESLKTQRVFALVGSIIRNSLHENAPLPKSVDSSTICAPT